ncbi:WD40-repeat-containing domain protein [Melanogaster broomeanus]|nr:WD40-repeat-containing domain protein [Melanogaster broomeanus]
MVHSDSEGEAIDGLEYDGTTDGEGDDEIDNEIDEELLGALEAGVDDVTDADEDSRSEDSDEEDDEEESEPSIEPTVDTGLEPSSPPPVTTTSKQASPQSPTPESPTVIPQVRPRSPSPAAVRKRSLIFPLTHRSQLPRSFTVEAICALPHPVPTHSLASSFCMTHLLTGSDDGYIRDYDIFAAVNGKVTLTAPQRHHCNVVEGNMKSGQIRYWWENPDSVNLQTGYFQGSEPSLSPVYSLGMQSDALWALGGTSRGHINLFTVRHDPGRLMHVLQGHRGPISGLSIDHDEKGFFSASWDGEAIQWDLNTGQAVRKFTAHGAQLVGVAVRPQNSLSHLFSPTSSADAGGESEAYTDASANTPYKKHEDTPVSASVETFPSAAGKSSQQRNSSASVRQNAIFNVSTQESDAKSDTSFDPLFDDEPDADGEADNSSVPNSGASQITHSHKENTAPGGHVGLAVPDGASSDPITQAQQAVRSLQSSVAPPKNAPPLLSAENSATFSPDILMISAIDGQIMLWDKRVNTPGKGVGRLWLSEKTPPWCVSACWSTDGSHIYAGRRNGTVDVWDVRMLGRSGPSSTPRLLKSLRNPGSSGVVSCVVPFPDGRHIACASIDNIRLWNATEAGEIDGNVKTRGGVQFKIIPGHHGGYVSQMIVDPGARFLVSASSNRGWHGDSTRTVFVHEIKTNA